MIPRRVSVTKVGSVDAEWARVRIADTTECPDREPHFSWAAGRLTADSCAPEHFLGVAKIFY